MLTFATAIQVCTPPEIQALRTAALSKINEPPNIVIILVDDLGYGDLGITGVPDIRTPRIDALASAGTFFCNAYVTSPICAPSRASLLTGRYQQRFGFEDLGGTYPEPEFGIPQDEHTLAEYLQDAGYTTAIVGKWDLGIRDDSRPLRSGFNTFFGFLPGQNDYLQKADVKATAGEFSSAKGGGEAGRRGPHGIGRAFAIFENHRVVDEPDYLTDAFGRVAATFIEENAERPFFLYLAFSAPHTPMEATPEYLVQYPDLRGGRRVYAAMVSAIDAAVGRVISALKGNGIEDNTLVFFLSDNGGASGQGVALTNYSDNHPLRGRKATFWEGGIRVPFIASWPGQIPAGVVEHNLTSTLDIVPTVLAATNVEPLPGHPLDGRSLLPQPKSAEQPHGTTLFWRYHNHFAVRQGDWKAILLHNQEPLLFNISLDITESRNLARLYPDKLQSLEKVLADWNSTLEPPRWTRRFKDDHGLIRRIPLPLFEPNSGVSYDPQKLPPCQQ